MCTSHWYSFVTLPIYVNFTHQPVSFFQVSPCVKSVLFPPTHWFKPTLFFNWNLRSHVIIILCPSTMVLKMTNFILCWDLFVLFFYHHLSPLCSLPPPRPHHHIVVHIHESSFLFNPPLSPTPSLFPHQSCLPAFYESVSIFLGSSVH